MAYSVKFTEHAIDRMDERRIKKREVVSAVLAAIADGAIALAVDTKLRFGPVGGDGLPRFDARVVLDHNSRVALVITVIRREPVTRRSKNKRRKARQRRRNGNR